MIHAKWQRVVLHTEVMKAQAMVSLSTNKTVPRKVTTIIYLSILFPNCPFPCVL